MKKEYKKPFVQIKKSQTQENLDQYTRKIKASDDVMLREIAGEHILIPIGEISMKVHGMITLTESGRLLWQKMQKNCTEAELVSCILDEYDIDRETAEKDVHEFLGKMDRIGILEYSDNEVIQ